MRRKSILLTWLVWIVASLAVMGAPMGYEPRGMFLSLLWLIAVVRIWRIWTDRKRAAREEQS